VKWYDPGSTAVVLHLLCQCFMTWLTSCQLWFW